MEDSSIIALPTRLFARSLPSGALFRRVLLIIVRSNVDDNVLLSMLWKGDGIHGLVAARTYAYIEPYFVSVLRVNVSIRTMNDFTLGFRISLVRHEFSEAVVRGIFGMTSAFY